MITSWGIQNNSRQWKKDFFVSLLVYISWEQNISKDRSIIERFCDITTIYLSYEERKRCYGRLCTRMMSGCRKTKKRKIHFRKATRLLRVPSIVLLDSIIMIRGIKQTNCPLLWDVLEKTDNVRMFDVQITNWYGKDRLEISVLHPKKLEEGLQQRLIWCCQLPWPSFFFLFHPI